MLFTDSLGILGLSPDSSLTGFLRFSIWRRENGAEQQGASGKGGKTIFRATQRSNVGTMLQPFKIMSQQCCNAVLR